MYYDVKMLLNKGGYKMDLEKFFSQIEDDHNETIEIKPGQWIAPDDFPEKVNNYIMDWLEFDVMKTPDDFRNASPLLFSSLCMYIGVRLRVASPIHNTHGLKWYNAPGAGDYIESILPLFLSVCFSYDKIPHTADFWRFAGLAPSELINNYVVAGGFSPGWLENAINTIKEAEKTGLESVMIDKKYSTQGIATLLQHNHGYTSPDNCQKIALNVITADSLPDFRQIAQKENDV